MVDYVGKTVVPRELSVQEIYDKKGKWHDLDALPALLGGVRRKSVEHLGLRKGDVVLEVGCGTGSNLAHLQRAVGVSGKVFGVEFSSSMLKHAEALCVRKGWENVSLTYTDVIKYEPPEPLHAVFFGFSYNTIPNMQGLLRRIKGWMPHGTICVMDASVPKWLLFAEPVLERYGQRLGSRYNGAPWDDLEAYGKVEMRRYVFDAYYSCVVRT